MKRDWKASIERVRATFMGETPDRVPLFFLVSEAIGTRISGLTVRELLRDPRELAEESIHVGEVLGNDILDVCLSPYCGPYEAIAYSKVNAKTDKIIWKDYDAPFIREGELCKTEKDIEDLVIPEHSKVEPWPTILDAMAIVQEKTGVMPTFAPSLTWSNIQMLRGSQAYLDVLNNPDLILKLCDKIYASQWDYYEVFCKRFGKPTSMFNCQYAFNKNMLSFQDAWKFEGQFVNKFCRVTGLSLIIHNCGFEPYWDELLNKHKEEGVEVIAVNGNNPNDLDEWVQFRKKFPDVVIIGASIFVCGELRDGTAEEVEELVKQNIIKLAPYKRFIVCPVCDLPWRVSLSNIFAVREAVEKYGRYPIKVKE